MHCGLTEQQPNATSHWTCQAAINGYKLKELMTVLRFLWWVGRTGGINGNKHSCMHRYRDREIDAVLAPRFLPPQQPLRRPILEKLMHDIYHVSSFLCLWCLAEIHILALGIFKAKNVHKHYLYLYHRPTSGLPTFDSKDCMASASWPYRSRHISPFHAVRTCVGLLPGASGPATGTNLRNS